MHFFTSLLDHDLTMKNSMLRRHLDPDFTWENWDISLLKHPPPEASMVAPRKIKQDFPENLTTKIPSPGPSWYKYGHKDQKYMTLSIVILRGGLGENMSFIIISGSSCLQCQGQAAVARIVWACSRHMWSPSIWLVKFPCQNNVATKECERPSLDSSPGVSRHLQLAELAWQRGSGTLPAAGYSGMLRPGTQLRLVCLPGSKGCEGSSHRQNRLPHKTYPRF